MTNETLEKVVVQTVDKAMAPSAEPKTSELKIEEPKIETKAEPKKDDVDVSNRFAALTRATRQLELERKSFREEQEKRMQEFKQLEEIKKQLEKAKYDPIGTLKSLGLKVDDIVNAAMNDGKPDPYLEIRNLKEEIQREKEDRENKEKQKQQESLLNQVRDNINKTIIDNKDAYELIDALDARGLVFDVMVNYAKESGGEYLPEKEACDQVEKYLTETVLPKIKTSKKLGLGLEKNDESAAKTDTGDALTKTLTNSNTQAPSAIDDMPLDPEMRLKALLKKYGAQPSHI